MIFLTREQVVSLVVDAIKGRKVLRMTYQRKDDGQVVTRVKAPFDIGTTNPATMEGNSDNLYAFCFDHNEKDTGLSKPFVHPIKVNRVISIEPTGEVFNENELADINMANSPKGYDYRSCKFAIVPDRNWFQ